MAFQEQFISAERLQDLVNAPEYQDRVLELVEGVIEVTVGDLGFGPERNQYGGDVLPVSEIFPS